MRLQCSIARRRGRKLGYAPPGHHLWDPWFIKGKDGTWHMFHLMASSEGDPDARHDKAFIGHSVSRDLRLWQQLPPALVPGVQGSWDDLALWTGSCFRHNDGSHYLFYTGRQAGRDRLLQRIGVAKATDSTLTTWEKHLTPVMSASSRYDTASTMNPLGKVPAWRDPFVFVDPISGQVYAAITAREYCPSRVYNGCIALARATSADLTQWELLAPLLSPKRYDEMEVPQLVAHDGLWYLFFLTAAELYEPAWAAANGRSHGLHCYVASDLMGPYRPVNKGTGAVLNDPLTLGLRLLEPLGDGYLTLGWTPEPSVALGRPHMIVLNGDEVTARPL
ncbi:MAG TPA: glycoside hydrolase family 68 protein [Candidatus Saccharimonadales bacterium]|nr:glycoside hydrolase family 68 protein [Candidatus Saccharimonadales bacterium]